MDFALMRPPGAGKGTHANLLCDLRGVQLCRHPDDGGDIAEMRS